MFHKGTAHPKIQLKALCLKSEFTLNRLILTHRRERAAFVIPTFVLSLHSAAPGVREKRRCTPWVSLTSPFLESLASLSMRCMSNLPTSRRKVRSSTWTKPEICSVRIGASCCRTSCVQRDLFLLLFSNLQQLLHLLRGDEEHQQFYSHS